MSCYAIKSIDNRIIDKIVYTWTECSNMVLHHKAVYKSCDTEVEAHNFFNTAPITVQEFTGSEAKSNALKTHAMKFRVKFNSPIYTNNDNSSCIYSYYIYENEMLLDRVTCIGAFLPSFKNIVYELEGNWKQDKKRGYQFYVTSFKEILEKKEEIVTYLSSAIKGIGIVSAMRMYEKYEADIFEVIENDPEELLSVKGISPRKLKTIVQSYDENQQAKEIIQYLLSFGVSTKLGYAVYKKYGIQSIQVTKKTPYIISQAIKGITFEIADQIAKKENLPMDSMERFLSCAEYVLKKAEYKGHLGLDKDTFGKQVLSLLRCPEVTPQLILDNTVESIQNKKLIYKTLIKSGNRVNYIMLPVAYQIEQDIAENIYRISSSKCMDSEADLTEKIKNASAQLGITLDAVQEDAIRTSILSQISVISGGPGTGKTTIIKVIAEYYKKEHENSEMIFLAPTGRAARRITESTGYAASTIHSKLNIYDSDEESEAEPIDNAFICIDEFSMTDVFVMNSLMKAIGENCKVIFIGDANQLPSVGAGAVLRDIIDSETIPVTLLNKVYRQAQGSTICTNAELIKQGNINLVSGNDFHITEKRGTQAIEDFIIEETMKMIQKYGIENVACLSPYKDHTAGVKSINLLLQAKINPPSIRKPEIKYGNTIFRVFDRVMNLRNNPDEDIANGDIGTIKFIEKKDEETEITVEYDSKLVTYTSENMENLTLAYCSTYHKSQGSEYDAVVACLSNFNSQMLKRNLIYTGATRAKKEFTVVGEREALNTAIMNEDDSCRNTLLWYHLRCYFGKVVII